MKITLCHFFLLKEFSVFLLKNGFNIIIIITLHNVKCFLKNSFLIESNCIGFITTLNKLFQCFVFYSLILKWNKMGQILIKVIK